VAGAVILKNGLRRLLRTRRIYIHGMPALATVIFVFSTSRDEQRSIMPFLRWMRGSGYSTISKTPIATSPP